MVVGAGVVPVTDVVVGVVVVVVVGVGVVVVVVTVVVVGVVVVVVGATVVVVGATVVVGVGVVVVVGAAVVVGVSVVVGATVVVVGASVVVVGVAVLLANSTTGKMTATTMTTTKSPAKMYNGALRGPALSPFSSAPMFLLRATIRFLMTCSHACITPIFNNTIFLINTHAIVTSVYDYALQQRDAIVDAFWIS